MEDRLKRLNQVFQDVFDDDELNVTPQTAAKDIEGWDSLMHVTLVVNVEKAFKVKFSSSEVASLQNVGDLLSLIEAHSPAS
jgi:acyl carrier protein